MSFLLSHTYPVVFDADGATPAAEFAHSVVTETLKSNPRAWLYIGNNSWLVWTLSTFRGRRGFVSMVHVLIGIMATRAV